LNGNWSKNAFVYLLILVAAAALFLNIYGPGETPQTKSLSEIAALIGRGEIQQIDVQEEKLKVLIIGSEQPFVSRKEEGIPLTRTLQGLGVDQAKLAAVKINVLPPSSSGNWFSLVLNLLPLLLIAGLFLFLFRQSQSGNNQALSFGKSKARMFTGDRPTITFDDVAGSD